MNSISLNRSILNQQFPLTTQSMVALQRTDPLDRDESIALAMDEERCKGDASVMQPESGRQRKLLILNQLQQGRSLIANSSSGLRSLTWRESFGRLVSSREAKKQDHALGEWLIDHLNHLPKEQSSKTFDAIAKFAKVYKTKDPVFHRLENTIFAHKCINQLPSLKIEELIRSDGTAKTPLLSFLKQNSLHYVIPKASANHRDSAILIDGKKTYIRSKNGRSFLSSTKNINLILKKISPSHPDASRLKKLRTLLGSKRTFANSKQIIELKKQLELNNYKYQAIPKVLTDEKGILLMHGYLADGIEMFHHSKWDTLRPNFREASSQPTYQLRVVTKIPTYALEKSFFGMISNIVRNILDFRAHGHTWIELTAPIHHRDGKFANEQNVYNVGYYFHPLDRLKRFESTDPIAYMPIPKEQLVVKEYTITQEQFKKARFYIEEVQKMIKDPNHTLIDKPKNFLPKENSKEISYLYKSMLKSTCLCFANTLTELVTGVQKDHRSCIRRWLFPKTFFHYEDYFDCIIERSIILKNMACIPRFFWRMELPVWVTKNDKK